MRIAITSLLLLVLSSVLSVADIAPTTPPYDWKSLDAIIGATGELKDEVYTYRVPREDLNVTVDGMDVPTAAGIASEFHFFKCSCGKFRVIGQFCCVDYESNDVIDAVRNGEMIEIANVGPMLMDEKPRLTTVRFQGEGDATALAKLLKSGLNWMGEARSATQPIERK